MRTGAVSTGAGEVAGIRTGSNGPCRIGMAQAERATADRGLS